MFFNYTCSPYFLSLLFLPTFLSLSILLENLTVRLHLLKYLHMSTVSGRLSACYRVAVSGTTTLCQSKLPFKMAQETERLRPLNKNKNPNRWTLQQFVVSFFRLSIYWYLSPPPPAPPCDSARFSDLVLLWN